MLEGAQPPRTSAAGVPMLQLKCFISSTLKSAEHVNKSSLIYIETLDSFDCGNRF